MRGEVMTPDQYRRLYLGEYPPHPFENLSYFELVNIEKDKFADREDRRLARKIRIERDDRNDTD